MKHSHIRLSVIICTLCLFSTVMFSTNSIAEKQNKQTLGIKELLKIGVQNAVESSGKKDGFYMNELIKISLPDQLKKVDSIVRKLGGSELSESLVRKMNSAAEKAVPLALDTFLGTVRELTVIDAVQLISGGDDSITKFLHTRSSVHLKTSFYPVVKNVMEEMQVVKTYEELIRKHKSNPLTRMLGLDMDISQYVTDKAIDGLFILIANEEKKIRRDPASRVTELLKGVFGKRR